MSDRVCAICGKDYMWCRCEGFQAHDHEIERLREELSIARDSYYSCNRALNMANERIEELERQNNEMKWTEIDYDGAELLAKDFLNGVLVVMEDAMGYIFIPGYYVQEQLGDMDGPALRERQGMCFR